MATPTASDDTQVTTGAPTGPGDTMEIGPDGKLVPKRKPQQQGLDISSFQNSGFGQIILFFLALLQAFTGKNPLIGAMEEDAFDRTKGEGSSILVRKPGSRSGKPGAPGTGPVSLEDFNKTDKFPSDIKFTSARRAGNDVIYTGENGEEVVKHRESTTSASRSWVNNNPGNIEFGSFSKKMGAIGTDGRFAIFPSVEAGFNAQATLLKSGTYKDLTLAQAIAKYAPPHENDTQAYVDYVSQKTGISANTRMGDLAMPDLLKITYAMAKHEGWKPGQILAKGLDDGRAGIPDQGFQAPGGALTLNPPIDSVVTSGFGARDTGIANASRDHHGIDMRAAIGTPLVAQAPVQVAYSGPSSGYGNVAILNHGNGVFTVYGHIESDGLAKTGTVLEKGQSFAKSGNEGVGNAPHLHYEVLLQGKDGRVYNVNPEKAFGKNLNDPQIREALIADAGNKISRVFNARVPGDLRDTPTQIAQASAPQAPQTPTPSSTVTAAATPETKKSPATPAEPAKVAAATPAAEKPTGTPHHTEGTSFSRALVEKLWKETEADRAAVTTWFNKAVEATARTAEAKPADAKPDVTANTDAPSNKQPLLDETHPAIAAAKRAAPAPAPA